MSCECCNVESVDGERPTPATIGGIGIERYRILCSRCRRFLEGLGLDVEVQD